MAKLITIVRQAPIEPDMPIPEIMIVASPAITEPKGSIAMKFKGSKKRCIGLSHELEIIAKEYSTLFFDASLIIEPSSIDGIHLDEDQHQTLGKAVANKVLSII